MDFNEKKYSIKLDENNVIDIETGWLARQASGAAILKCKDTFILATSTMAKEEREGQDFFPLTVEYKEKYYAAGRIPGGFIKREGKPREKEVLVSRLIDRPLRPLFDKSFLNEVQVITQVLSMDPEVSADVHAITASSISLLLSDIPFKAAVSGVRVGRIDGQFVLNPSYAQIDKSDIDLIVAGTEKAVLMIEGVSKIVTEEDMISAVEFAHTYIRQLCQFQNTIARECGKAKFVPEIKEHSEYEKTKLSQLRERIYDKLKEACFINEKLTRNEAIEMLKKQAKDDLLEEISKEKENQENLLISLDQWKKLIGSYLHDLEKEIVRDSIIKDGKRIDGRALTEVRDIDIRLGILPRAHGSALFTRGQTQSLGVVTLGTAGDMQRTDDLEGESAKKFMLHYNFPSYSVGEVGRMSGPGRREIGHGNLAERALENIIPDHKVFPYTIRVVSDIMESNGSSSMASVCSGSLAMAQAGVPIKAMVAGVAMGLIIGDDGKYAILTDISGTEDHLGDMDFKVAGSVEGITSFQLDIKVEGITAEIMKHALAQAKQGRLYILEKMNQILPKPAEDLSDYAPRITTVQIDTEKIGELIGPGGRNIRAIIEASGAEINIEDSGVVTIAATNLESSQKAIELIRASTAEVQVGQIYEGKVKRIMEYGAFIEIIPGKEGLCHISKLDRKRVRKVTDVVQEGEMVKVKVIGIDRSGKIDLSRKDTLPWE